MESWVESLVACHAHLQFESLQDSWVLVGGALGRVMGRVIDCHWSTHDAPIHTRYSTGGLSPWIRPAPIPMDDSTPDYP